MDDHGPRGVPHPSVGWFGTWRRGPDPLRNMIDHLEDEHGYTRQQAYAICSVAVDLKLSEIVDSPNYVVTAELPLDVLT